MTGRNARIRKTIVLIVAMFAAFFAILPSVSAQDDVPVGPSGLKVHRVDSRTSAVEVIALSDDYSATSASVKENGDEKSVAVSTLRSTGLAREIVFVIDTSQRLRRSDALFEATGAIAAEIRNLPAGTSVGLVEAAGSPVIIAELSTDLDAVARAVESLEFSDGGVILGGVAKAAGMLSEPDAVGEIDTIQTVVVLAGGPDVGSAFETGLTRGELIRKGAQVVAIQYNGGDSSLAALSSATGGLKFNVPSIEELSTFSSNAAIAAGDRYVLSYEGVSDLSQRGDVSLQIGNASTDFSYDGGELTIRTVALQLSTNIKEPSAFGFFESQTGFYITLLLSFLGIGMVIFLLGSTFAGGQTSLEGMLARYSSGEEELDEEESNIVQTALVQRAVELSESFAEDRGFLIKVEELLERAKLPLRPGEAMSFYAAGIFFGIFIGFFLLGGVLGGLIVGFGVAIGAIFVLRFKAKRRMRSFEKQLPDTLTLLAGTLRAGYSLPQGLEAVSKESADPMGYELRRVMTEARLGREMEEALAAAAERLSSPDFAWAVMAISIQREVGGNLNELLMTVADTMIARERLKGEVATLTAEGKMSAILLGGLPPGLGVVMWVMNPEYINQLFVTFLGNVFLGLGIVSSVIGLAWMKKVITIDV